LVIFVFGTVAAICFFERAHRRIPVQYTNGRSGRKDVRGAQSYLPLKINVSGVIPPIFASSILMFPAADRAHGVNRAGSSRSPRCCTGGLALQRDLHPARHLLRVLHTSGRLSTRVDIADNLKKGGGFVPGNQARQEHRRVHQAGARSDHVRGALYLPVVCMIPAMLHKYMQVPFPRRHRLADRRGCLTRRRPAESSPT